MRPLVVDWPSPERLALEAQVAGGTVVVHYAGCKLEVLRQCHAPGAYKFGAATRQEDRVSIHNSDELHAAIPAYAASFEASLKRAGSLDVKMAIVGAWVADMADVHASMLEGDCTGATHVVSALTVGAFEFGTTAGAAASASGGIGGAGAGGRSETMKEVLSRAGDPLACAASRTDMNAPPEGCGAVVRLDLRSISGLSGAGATRCKIDLGAAKCPRVPTLPATFDDAYQFADTDPSRCERRGKEWYQHCGGSDAVTARFYRNGKIDREFHYGGEPTRCRVTLRDCPRNPAAVGTFNDEYETSATDEVRCLQRGEEYWSYCGGAQPITMSFFSGGAVHAEQTVSHPTRCQIVLPDCARSPSAAGILNDTYEGADKDAARCMKRAREYVVYCASSKTVSARYFEGSKLIREERASPAGTRCVITLPDCPRKPDATGTFNDEWEHADVDPNRCMRRADEYWAWCGTGVEVTSRFFRGDAAAQERRFSSPTRCQVTLSACPSHPEIAGALNDAYDKADVDAARCAKRAAEYVQYCGGGGAVTRFYRGATLERETRAP